MNLSSQLEACSFGKLVTVPGPDPTWNNGALTSLEGIEAAPGVLEIDMGVNMNGMTKADIYNLFVSKNHRGTRSRGYVSTWSVRSCYIFEANVSHGMWMGGV